MRPVRIFIAAIFLVILILPFITCATNAGSEEQPADPGEQLAIEAGRQALANKDEQKQGYLSQEREQTDLETDKQPLVSMDFEDADIRDVIRVIAMASGMNMVIGKDVAAKVTISLKDLHWEKALDVILRTYNFTYKREENLIRIMTFEKVKQEEKDIPLATKIIYLNFADVEKLQETVAGMLSDRGSIAIDARTNSMLITDVPPRVEEAEKVAKKLDSRTPQVLIEAMLVDVKLTKDDELGVNWKIIHVNRPLEQGESPNYIEQPQGVMGLANAHQAIKFAWLKEFAGYDLSGLISAWIQDAKANILASPKIVTLDNQTAKIEIKSQVAYTETTTSTENSTGLESTQFKDVVTSLEVTPHITKEGFVSMNIKPKQEFVEGTTEGQPQIGSRSAETNVLVADGETIVIGGLRKVEDNATIVKVPILGDIPFLGRLFRSENRQKINTELVMFVTPHIIIQPKLTDEEIIRYEMLDHAREDFLRRQEKERQKRLKKSKKQAFLTEPDIAQETALPAAEIKEAVSLPAPQEEKKTRQDPQDLKGYIYSW